MAITDDEKRGYAKGYAAGKRRRMRVDQMARLEARRAAFRQRAFLAALPGCVTAQNWQTGDKKPITSMTSRVSLAWDFAEDALKRFW